MVYDNIEIPDGADQIICHKDGKAGLIHGYTKTEILPFKYEDIITVSNVSFCVCKKGKWGLVVNGVLELGCDFDFIYPQRVIPLFTKYMMVEKDGKYGLCKIDTTPFEIRWHFKPSVRLYNQYYGAKTPFNTCAIVDAEGNIVFPFLSHSIFVTTNPEKRFVQDIGGLIVLDEKLDMVCNNIDRDDPAINDLRTLNVFGNAKNVKIDKQNQKQKEQKASEEKGSQNQLNITDTSVSLMRKGKVQYDKQFDEVKATPNPEIFICRSNDKYGLVMATQIRVVVLTPVSYTNIVCNEDGSFTLIRETKKKIEEYLFTANNTGNDIVLVSSKQKNGLPVVTIRKRKGKCELVVNNSVINDFELEDAKRLFGLIFKFKRPFSQWGILRINTEGPVEIIRTPEYTSISVLDVKTRQVRLEREGKRPSILKLR